MHTRLRTNLAGVLLLTGTLLTPAASSAQTPQACLATQLRGLSNACSGMSKCYATAMKKGAAVDPACIAKKTTLLGFSFAEAEAMASCLVEGASSTVAAQVAGDADAIAASLTLAGGRCAASKMNALGKECAGFFRCRATADGGSTTVDPSCLAIHTSRLTEAFTKAEAKGGCATTGDRTALETQVAALAEDARNLLRGSGTTTTTTSTSTSTVTLP